ncbi:MAG: DUF1674 domain-containing protein [Rhodanobacter sp.]
MSDTPTPVESTPVAVEPATASVAPATAPETAVVQRPVPDPTRYGDWEKNGRCIDF